MMRANSRGRDHRRVLLIVWGLAGVLVAVGGEVRGEVTDSSESGFRIRHEVTIEAKPQAVYAQFVAIDQWWSPNHTYGGKAEGLRLDAKAGGGFYEALPDGGSVEHLRVVFVSPGRVVRFTGGLGPLQQEAVVGVLTVMFKPQGDGQTQVTWEYKVHGYDPEGMKRWGEPVDRVLGEQVGRLKQRVEGNSDD